MAKFKSAILTQASGSVGGVTFASNSSGMYMRARSMPTNPNTALQQVVRNATSTLSQRWVTVLTDEQRELWGQYAANVARKNALGDTIHLSGISMYVRCNVVRIQVEEAIVDAAPSVYTLGDGLAGLTVTQAAATPFAVSASWTAPTTVEQQNATVVVFVSRPQNSSINFFRGPYRYNTLGIAEDGPLVLEPNPSWVANQKLFVRVVVLYTDGRVSDAQQATISLTATPV